MRPRGSLTGPLVLIVVGAIFLIHAISPEFAVGDLFLHYWPYLLILWGVIALIEVSIRFAGSGQIPANGVSGGGWALVVFICLAGVAAYEMHRANPACSSCHRFMDPIGLALDNFDVTAKWRERENGVPLDTRGDFYDGTPVTKPSELTAALLKRPVPLVRTFAENLMAYALGRRVEYFDQPAIRAIAKTAAANDYKMSSFILGIIKSDAFQMRRADPSPTQ